MAGTQVNLYEAKTNLSSLVERAAKGEEIVIAKAGKPIARLSAILKVNEFSEPQPLHFGQNLMGITLLADDWNEDLPPQFFENPEGDKLFFAETKK